MNWIKARRTWLSGWPDRTVFMNEDFAAIDQIVEHLRRSQSILFITGAGMSADSGLPTYRGIGGLYNVNTTPEGYSIEELLSGSMMQQRPELTWKYLAEIARACHHASFNRGHQVIAEMERHFPRVWTLTQNVDGFHRQSGSQQVIEIHGDLHDVICTQCSYRHRYESFDQLEIPPSCPHCQAVLRPDVVLFGEMLPLDKIRQLQRELENGFDMVFSVGTTSVFPYISAPVEYARATGRPTVEINPGESEVSEIVDVKLNMRAAPALDAIWQRFQGGD